MDRNLKINSPEMLGNVLKEKKREGREALSKEEQIHADHVAISTQAIKIINSSRMDAFVKKVMTLRILGPIITGNERTHMSIALELGVSVDDVIQAELYGIEEINNLLQKIEVPEFINQFNKDEAVKMAVSKLGKSA